MKHLMGSFSLPIMMIIICTIMMININYISIKIFNSILYAPLHHLYKDCLNFYL